MNSSRQSHPSPGSASQRVSDAGAIAQTRPSSQTHPTTAPTQASNASLRPPTPEISHLSVPKVDPPSIVSPTPPNTADTWATANRQPPSSKIASPNGGSPVRKVLSPRSPGSTRSFEDVHRASKRSYDVSKNDDDEYPDDVMSHTEETGVGGAGSDSDSDIAEQSIFGESIGQYSGENSFTSSLATVADLKRLAEIEKSLKAVEEQQTEEEDEDDETRTTPPAAEVRGGSLKGSQTDPPEEKKAKATGDETDNYEDEDYDEEFEDASATQGSVSEV